MWSAVIGRCILVWIPGFVMWGGWFCIGKAFLGGGCFWTRLWRYEALKLWSNVSFGNFRAFLPKWHASGYCSCSKLGGGVGSTPLSCRCWSLPVGVNRGVRECDTCRTMTCVLRFLNWQVWNGIGLIKDCSVTVGSILLLTYVIRLQHN